MPETYAYIDISYGRTAALDLILAPRITTFSLGNLDGWSETFTQDLPTFMTA